jgi:hypothetical protein
MSKEPPDIISADDAADRATRKDAVVSWRVWERSFSLALALAGAFYLAARVVFLISDAWHVNYVPYDHTVGCVSLLEYPKGKEYPLFLMAMVLCPLFMLAAYYLWAAFPYGPGAGAAGRWLVGGILFAPFLHYLVCVFPVGGVLLFAGVMLLLFAPLLFFLCIRLRGIPRKGRWMSAAYLVAIVVICLVVAGLNYHHFRRNSVDQFHEGAENLAPGQAFLEGEMPYRDYFVVHGLGFDTFTTAISFKLFGNTVYADRLLRFILTIAAALTVAAAVWYFLGRTFISLALGVVAAPISHYRYIFTYLMIIAAVKYARTGGRLWAGVCGLTAALSLVYSVDAGFVALVMGGLWIAACGLFAGRSLSAAVAGGLSFLAGALAVLAPVAVWLGVNDALRPLVEQAVVVFSSMRHAYGLPFKTLGEMWIGGNLSMMIFFCYAILGISIYLGYALVRDMVLRRWSRAHWPLLLLFMMNILFMQRAFGRSDVEHIPIAGHFAVLAVLLLFGMYFRKSAPDKPALPHAATDSAAALFIIAMMASMMLAAAGVPAPPEYLSLHSDEPLDPLAVSLFEERVGPVEINREERDEIVHILGYLMRNCGPNDTIYDFTMGGFYYYVLPFDRPGRCFSSHYAGPWSVQRALVAEFRRKPPRFIIFDLDQRNVREYFRRTRPDVPVERYGVGRKELDGVNPELRHALISQYIVENYRPVKVFGRYAILERGEPAVAAPAASARATGLPRHRDLLVSRSNSYFFGWIPRQWAEHYPETISSAQSLAAPPLRRERDDSGKLCYRADIEVDGKEVTYILLHISATADTGAVIYWHAEGRPRDESSGVDFRVRKSDEPLPYLIRLGSLSGWRWVQQPRTFEMEQRPDLTLHKIEFLHIDEY